MPELQYAETGLETTTVSILKSRQKCLNSSLLKVDKLIDKIFEPYFLKKESLVGTGLGLYMSKMLIEKNMKGSLTVQNTKKGAAFTIEITTN
jgi:Signal transduction histidine kinase